jgi:hypothetical protein
MTIFEQLHLVRVSMFTVLQRQYFASESLLFPFIQVFFGDVGRTTGGESILKSGGSNTLAVGNRKGQTAKVPRVVNRSQRPVSVQAPAREAF